MTRDKRCIERPETKQRPLTFSRKSGEGRRDGEGLPVAIRGRGTAAAVAGPTDRAACRAPPREARRGGASHEHVLATRDAGAARKVGGRGRPRGQGRGPERCRPCGSHTRQPPLTGQKQSTRTGRGEGGTSSFVLTGGHDQRDVKGLRQRRICHPSGSHKRKPPSIRHQGSQRTEPGWRKIGSHHRLCLGHKGSQRTEPGWRKIGSHHRLCCYIPVNTKKDSYGNKQ